jgi:predicted transposase YbfD/YdcC
LKENQETLYNDVQQLFLDGLENDFADIKHHCYQTVDVNHGRVETRTYHVVPVPEELAQRHSDWQGLRSFGMVFSERQVGQEEATFETRFFINSLAPKVTTFARAVRGHWDIENSLHWVLDISFREDDSRLRKDHGPENLALLRRLAASLLHNEGTSKGGVACKRKEAGWDNGYLLEVLGASLK